MNSKWASLLALGFVVVGCASAQIRKVPKRSDYDAQTWERERKQQYADSLCGLRFYRSRPYVNVYKPFPLESDVVLVDGVVSADGKWVQLTPNGASRKIVGDLCLLGACTPSGNLPASAVLATGSASVSKSERDVMLAQGATASGTGGGATLRAQGATDAADPTLVAPGELDRIAPHATAEDRPSGTSTLRLSTDLDAVAQTKLRDYFDIQYLPDFEEEYVVDPRANLGEVNVTLTQGPGGVLMAMGMQVDNSAITRPLVDAYTELVKQGAEVAKTALGKAGGLKAQGATAGDQSLGTLPGTQVTLRVHVVKMASPGLYPILKDSEMLENRHCVRELGHCMCPRCSAANAHVQAIVVPTYPYTRIAYQYFTTVVVEHLLDTSPAAPKLSLGAQGKAGDATTKGVSNAELLAKIDAQLKGETSGNCLLDMKPVEVVLRDPSTGPLESITRLSIRVVRRDMASVPPADAAACAAAVKDFIVAHLDDLRLSALAADSLTVIAQ